MLSKKLFTLIFFGLVTIHPLLVFGVDSCGADKKNDSIIELVFTQDELVEMGKWRDRGFNDITIDAMEGDKAALYMIGMSLLTGASGLTIDVHGADLFLEKSASLGFPPAIKQMINKYLEDENPFLMMVYINLLVSFGHREFVVNYHELRSNLIEKFGVGVSKEIENVASLKKEQILKNILDLAKSKEKMKFVLSMEYDDNLITFNDSIYNGEYWFRFSKFQLDAEKESQRFQAVSQKEYQNFKNKYEVSRKNFKTGVGLLNNKNEINLLKIKGLRDATSALRATEQFKDSMERFSISSNINIKRIAKEFSLLCVYGKGIIDQHYIFFTSPENYLNSELCLEKFEDYTNKFIAQHEYIYDIINELQSVNNQ